jgi:hypothetical protein
MREVVTALKAVSIAPSATVPTAALLQAPVRLDEPAPDVAQAGQSARAVRLGEPISLERVRVAAAAPILARAAAPRDEVEPLTADLRRLHITVTRQVVDKLEAAKAALAHSHPSGSAGEILDAALDLLLERAARRKGIVAKPRRTPPPSSDPSHIPAHVRRAVWERDGGCCQWKVHSGSICGSTHRLEFDHVMPLALGGLSTVENVRLLCAAHNQEAARRAFGDAWMDRFTGGGAAGSGPSPLPRRREAAPRDQDITGMARQLGDRS